MAAPPTILGTSERQKETGPVLVDVQPITNGIPSFQQNMAHHYTKPSVSFSLQNGKPLQWDLEDIPFIDEEEIEKYIK